MQKYFKINADRLSIQCKVYYDNLKHINTAIIFGHGFTGHKDNRAAERFATRALKKNSNLAIITFDWPGHGDDTSNKLTLEKCDKYLNHVIAYVQSQWNVNKIFGYATSFGGYLFLRYIAEYNTPFSKIALRCPAVNMYSILKDAIMTEEEYSKIEKGKNVIIGFDRKVEVTPQFLDELKKEDITKNDYNNHAKDILIIHGTKDQIVPFDDVKSFAKKNKIGFIAVDDADHRFLDPQKMDVAIAEILKLFDLQ